MLILFAPSKTFSFDGKKADLNLIFKDETNLIIDQIKSLSRVDFQKAFKLSDTLIHEVYDYYQSYETQDSYKAFELFKGESFKFLDYPNLKLVEQTYINKNVLVIDALYGLIKPNFGIKPYRLDFTVRSDLKRFWKDKITEYVASYHKEVVSLSSKEFDSILDNHKIIFYEVSFIDCKDDLCKKLSVLNKQMRGTLLKYLAINQINKVKDFPDQIGGYTKKIHHRSIEYIKVHE